MLRASTDGTRVVPSTAPRSPRPAPEVRSEPPSEVRQAPCPARRALRQPDRLQVHQYPDDPGEEVDRRADLLRGDGPRGVAHRAAGCEHLQAGAPEHQAGRGGEEPPCWWRYLPGAGRGSPRASHGAGDALAHELL